MGWRALGDLRRVLRSPQIRLALGNGGGDSETALPARHFYPAAVRALSPNLPANPSDFQAETFAKPQWQPYPFVQIFDLGINGYTEAQCARLKLKMERRRLVAKLLIKYRITDFPRCRRAADVPLVTGFAKVSGCLWAMATVHKAINIKQPETIFLPFSGCLYHVSFIIQ